MKPLLILAALLLAAQPAAAQPAPAPAQQPAPDPKLLAAQQAFEALPEAERRAIQQDLGFATAFNGAATGSFGPLTYRAIQSFEREQKLVVDGMLAPDERRQLAAVAQNARRALRFAVLDDGRTGARIGVPQNVFVKRETNAVGGSRWQTADGKATLDTTALPAGGETLQQIFDRTTAASPNRKITYKLMRPDFFVVTAETASGKSYRRMSLGPDGAIRGFAIGYDKAAAADLDKIVISIANSFEAFPTAAATQPAVAGAASVPTAAAAIPATAAPRDRLSTGLLLQGGFLLVAEAGVRDCRSLAVGPRRLVARVAASEGPGGLALIRAEGLPRAQALAAAAAPKSDEALTAIAQAWSGAQPGPIYAQAIAAGSDRIAAPLQPGGAGAALFDSAGALAGLVTDDPGARRQIAGVAPAARYRYAGPERIAAFLRANGAALAEGDGAKPAGGVAAQRREAVVALVCSL